mmetsp:Transcript_47121/g.54306  ORF Transcript_47121/g.54306 Transcript_47121/m.54306 type:complete len:160 (+) Transcript_47121:2-481(+)
MRLTTKSVTKGRSQDQGHETHNQIDPMIEMWKFSMLDLGRRDFDSAYKRVLDSGDDIYLLRLMHHTGPITNRLHPSVSKVVLTRINELMGSNFLAQMTVDWVQNAVDNGQADLIDGESLELTMGNLYEVSAHDSDIGVNAAELYSVFTSAYNMDSSPSM